MNNFNSSYAWIIFSIFIFGPFFLINLWSFRWWKEGRYLSNERYEFNAGYIFPRGPFAGLGPKNYKRTDARIEEEINDRLMLHGEIDATHVEVACHEGNVILSGMVKNRRVRRQVEEISDSVAGVQDIRNEVHVHSSRVTVMEELPGLKTKKYQEKDSKSAML